MIRQGLSPRSLSRGMPSPTIGLPLHLRIEWGSNPQGSFLHSSPEFKPGAIVVFWLVYPKFIIVSQARLELALTYA